MKSIERKAGDPIPTVIDLSEELGDHALLLAPNGPDWARTPPELGSQKLYFTDRFMVNRPCLACKADTRLMVSLFKDSDLFCMETLNCCKQFLWGRMP